VNSDWLASGEQVPDLATVIGENARRLRTSARLTLDQVAVAARQRGLNWSESRVADFESGRVAANLATILAVCVALDDLGCAKATPLELVRTARPIHVNDGLLLWSEDVAKLLSGRPLVRHVTPEHVARTFSPGFTTITSPYEMKISMRYPVSDPTVLIAVARASGAAEERVRKSLGISSMLLASLSAAFWRRTFTEERDHRAGKDANPQKRGQVTRQMRAELKTAIEATPHGNDK
jgi:transcriptional regulator with XRE-family HTH domain